MKKLNIVFGFIIFTIGIISIMLINNIDTEYVMIKPIVEEIPIEKADIKDAKYPMPIRFCEVVVFEDSKPKKSCTDTELIAKVVHAEAGNQDELGKRLIVDVILNRVDSKSFPDTICGVCNQSNQFAIHTSYTDDDMKAVLKELDSRTDYEIVFFRTNHFHSFGIPAYQHGDHYFSKEDL